MKIELKGFDELEAKLEALGEKSDEIIKKSLYAGAGVIADSVKKNIEALPTEDARWLKDGERYDVCTSSQKEAMASRFGISPMEDKGDSIDALIGFDDAGYIGKPTKKFPKGMPVKLLARSIESGSSVRQKHPFFRIAVNNSKKAAVEKEKSTASEEIQKIMKG